MLVRSAKLDCTKHGHYELNHTNSNQGLHNQIGYV
jgi:hypothetical protein